MAKWYGKIGYEMTVEEEPGLWVEKIVERPYYGDLGRNSLNIQSSSSVNDDINIANEISIVADPFANDNFTTMRYVEIMGKRWKVKNVEIKYPRLILTIGGVYNGEQAGIAE